MWRMPAAVVLIFIHHDCLQRGHVLITRGQHTHTAQPYMNIFRWKEKMNRNFSVQTAQKRHRTDQVVLQEVKNSKSVVLSQTLSVCRKAVNASLPRISAGGEATASASASTTFLLTWPVLYPSREG